MTETPAEQPRVPGVRYGKEIRYRPVVTHVFGEEHVDYEPYEVDVPLPPRDWDGVLMRFLMTVAIASTAVAVVWSTASISRLLSPVVGEPSIAVAAASLFELLWIVCLVAEWLLRGQPDRARPMQTAGWIAVVVVVAAVLVEGFHEHEKAAGIVGAAVSLMAKGSWWVVFRVRQVKLRRPVANALQRKLEDLSAAEALTSFKHRIGSRQAYAALTYGADDWSAAQATVQAANRMDEIPSGQRPDASATPSGRVQQPAPAAPPVPPPASPAPVPAPPTAPVPSFTQPPAPGMPLASPAEAPSGQPSVSVPPVPPTSGIAPSIASTVRGLLRERPGISDDDLIEAVKDVHGDRPKLGETVLRNRRKAQKKVS